MIRRSFIAGICAAVASLFGAKVAKAKDTRAELAERRSSDWKALPPGQLLQTAKIEPDVLRIKCSTFEVIAGEGNPGNSGRFHLPHRPSSWTASRSRSKA